jgi:chaperonin GroEL (HSP60 family)
VAVNDSSDLPLLDGDLKCWRFSRVYYSIIESNYWLLVLLHGMLEYSLSRCLYDFVIGNQVLGLCEIFEERQVGNERFNIFTGCPGGETATIVLRGGADQVSFIFYYNSL